MKLKSKLTFYTLSMLIIVMGMVITLSSVLISRQSEDVSREIINNSFNVVIYDLSERQRELVDTLQKLSSMEQTASVVTYISRFFKSITSEVDRVSTYQAYRKLALELYNTGLTANVWKLAIYDQQGDLSAFAVTSGDKPILGYAQGYPNPDVHFALAGDGQKIDDDSWKQNGDFSEFAQHLDGPLPDKPKVIFQQCGAGICLMAQAPITGQVYNSEKNVTESKQVGVALAVLKLDDVSLSRLFKLTQAKINIYSPDGFSAGELPQARTLADNTPAADALPVGLTLEGVRYGAIAIGHNDYYQGVLPIYNGNQYVGAIAAMYSKELARSHTLQMIRMLVVVAFCGILLFAPLAYWMARDFVEPISKMRDAMQRIRKGHYGEAVTASKKDELGDLASSFNQMSQDLYDSRRLIESKHDELVQAEAKYRNIFENAVEGIFQVSVDGKILNANPALAEMLGYAGTEELIRSVGNFHEDLFVSQETRQDFLNDVMNGHKLSLFEAQLRTSRGDTIWASISARLVRDDAGQAAFYEGSMLDVSARKQREQAEKEREAALLASRAKSDFLANMSHEIRTPINAIIGFTELGLRTELSPKQRDYLGKIDISAQSLLGIINDILDFSKIEAGKLGMESVNFSLEEVLANLTDMLGARAFEKGLELLLCVADDVPDFLVGDPLRLGQILSNLASNSVKFTAKGHIVLKVDKVEQNDGGEEVNLRFSVEDTGIGMTPDQVSRLFKPFSQADSSTTRKYGGTGLGLTIVKSLVEMMHGEISVTSELAGGSLFTFTARFGLGEGKEKPFAFPGELKDLRILVVDDMAPAREILSSTLKSFNFEVSQVASGEEAILELARAAADRPYQIVIMDWKMPGMDGIQAAREIQNNPALGGIPQILMVSAYDRDEILQQANAVNIAGFLTKPVNRSLLHDSIMNVFGKREGRISHEAAGRPEDMPELKAIRGARILLVEDNAINQQIVLEFLDLAGFVVDVANNGLEALEHILGESSHKPYDAVLMDLQMPEMDGYEATRRIRETIPPEALPIIALTAHALDTEREKCLAFGMNDYVTKPINVFKLYGALSNWIRPGDRAAPVSPARTTADGETVTLPDSLPGIRFQAGIDLMNGNEKLYETILRDFLRSHANDHEAIREALRTSGNGEATRLAHTLKGLCGSIGAPDLHESARILEQAIKDGRTEDYDTLLEAVEHDLGVLVSSLRQVIKERPSQTPVEGQEDAPPKDTAKLGSVLNELAEMLRDNNAQALNQFEELKAAVGTWRAASMDRLETLIADLEYEEALSELDSLARECNVTIRS